MTADALYLVAVAVGAGGVTCAFLWVAAGFKEVR